MALGKVRGLVALVAWSSGCAPVVDARALTPADKEQLLHEHEAAKARRRLEGGSPERPGCSSSTSASRPVGRQEHHGGSDSFDSRGCPEGSKGRASASDAKE